MGAAISRSTTPGELAELLSSLGTAYEAYAPIVIDNALDGGFILSISSEEEITEALTELGVSNKVHQRVLVGKILAVIEAAAAAREAVEAHTAASTSLPSSSSLQAVTGDGKPPNSSSTCAPTMVFLTHNWADGNHERVAGVNRGLQSRDVVTWFDSDRITGNVRRAMMDGIEHTQCAMVFITRVYRDKVNGADGRDNCQYEFNHAVEQLGPQRMIPVVMEAEMRNSREWRGVLGMALGGMLYVDMVGIDESSGQAFEAKMDELAALVKRIGGGGSGDMSLLQQGPPPPPPDEPIRLISFSTFVNHGKFPLYSEDKGLLTALEDINASESFLGYISHSWLRDRGFNEADNARGDKFELALEAAEWAWKTLAPLSPECFLWVDCACVDNSGPKNVDQIIRVMDCLVTPIIDKDHASWDLPSTPSASGVFEDYKAEGWTAYCSRAFCRLDAFLAAGVALPPSGKGKRLKFKGPLKYAAERGRRLHLLYGSKERQAGTRPIAVPPLIDSLLRRFSPADGLLARDAGRAPIAKLVAAVQSSWPRCPGCEQLESIRAGAESAASFLRGLRGGLLEANVEAAEVLDLITLFASSLSLRTESDDQLRAVLLDQAPAVPLADHWDRPVPSDLLDLLLDEVGGRPALAEQRLPSVLRKVRALMLNLAYLEAVANDSRPLRRSRLMIVGQGGAGKTSFFRALTSRPFEAQWKSTVGFTLADFAVIRDAGVDVQQYLAGVQWRQMDGVNEADRTLRSQIVDVAQAGKPQQLLDRESRTLAERLEDVREAAESALRMLPAPEASGSAGETALAALDAGLGAAEGAKSRPEDSSIDDLALAPQQDFMDSKGETAGYLGCLSLGFSSGEARALAFSVWDYGGQRVFQTVQHLFLSRYGVYVLAFDLCRVLADDAANAATCENALQFLQFWLRQVGLVALGAPVILLGTHMDKLAAQGLPEKLSRISKSLTERFRREPVWMHVVPNVAAEAKAPLVFFPVSNRVDDPNIERLRKIIEVAAEKDVVGGDAVSYVNAPTPVSWLRVCDRLKELEKGGVSYLLRHAEVGAGESERDVEEDSVDVDTLAEQCGVYEHASTPSERRLLLSSMLSLFNRLGLLVYIEEPGLDNVVILSPQWIIDCIVCVVRDFDLHPLLRDATLKTKAGKWRALRERGVASEDMLRKLWKEEVDNVPFLISFLKRQCLIASLPAASAASRERGPFVVPSILASDGATKAASRPEAEEASSLHGAVIAIRFPTFLPEGFLPRLVVVLIEACRECVMYQPRAPRGVDLNFFTCVGHAAAAAATPTRAPCVFLRDERFVAAIPFGSAVAEIFEGEEKILVCLPEAASASDSCSPAPTLDEIVAALTAALDHVRQTFYKSISFSIDDSAARAYTWTRPCPGPSLQGGGPVTYAVSPIVSLPVSPPVTPAATALDLALSLQAAREADEDSSPYAQERSDEQERQEDVAKIKTSGKQSQIARLLVDDGWDSVEKLQQGVAAGTLTQELVGSMLIGTGDRTSLWASCLSLADTPATPATHAAADAPATPAAAAAMTPTPSAVLPNASGRHVMISYNWAQKPLAEALTRALRARGEDVWRDEEGSSVMPKMVGGISKSMAKAVESSSAVVACISREYQGSANCMKEFVYAVSLRDERPPRVDKVIFVMTQRDFTPHSGQTQAQREREEAPFPGDITIEMRGELYYSLFTAADVEAVASQIQAALQPAGPSRPSSGDGAARGGAWYNSVRVRVRATAWGALTLGVGLAAISAGLGLWIVLQRKRVF